MKTRHAGFTLIELLVVVVVIGVSLSLIVVRLGSDDRSRLETEAQRLAQLLRHASDAAITEGRPLAWKAGPAGYSFARKSRKGWEELANDPILGHREWPASVRLSGVSIAGLPAAPEEPLVFHSGGSNAPYVLELASGELRVTVDSRGAGKARSLASPHP